MKKISFFLLIGAMLFSAYTTWQVSGLGTTTVSPSNSMAVAAARRTPTPTPNPRTGQIYVHCNNSLSDATTINAAIANSEMGDEIIMSGQCLINQTIKLLGDRTYRGTSRTGTVLKQADGANLVALLASETFLDNREWTGTPVEIRQIALDGNSQMNQQAETDGIILRAWMSVVENLFINDMRGNGLRVTNKSLDGTEMVTSQVNGRISANFINQSGRHGIYIEDSQNAVTDWFLTDNVIAFSGMDGIHLENAAGWKVERNHIYGVPQHAIYAEGIFATTISDNLLGGFGETGEVGTWYGIYASVQGGVGSTISNNRIFNPATGNPESSYRYIGLTTNYGVGMVNLTGNVIRGVISVTKLVSLTPGQDFSLLSHHLPMPWRM